MAASMNRLLLLALLALLATAILAEAASKARSQPPGGDAKAKAATNKRAGNSTAVGSPSGRKASARSQQSAAQPQMASVKKQRSADGQDAAGGASRVAGGRRHVNGSAAGGRWNGTAPPHSANGTRRGAVNGTDGQGRPHRAGPAGAGGRAAGGRGGRVREGNVVGVVSARMSGAQMVGSAGMVNGSGQVELRIVKTATDMDVHYSLSLSHLSSPSPPTSASILSGPASSASAALLLSFPTSTWTNSTRPFHRPRNTTNTAAAGPPAAARFSYGARGVWENASSLSAAAGGSVAAAVRNILAAPASFHALIATTAFPSGAVRGQMANMTRGGK
ncbi:hypothetical protein CLOM_g23777 [Closterium sp. NIES-68]|nr:hypothetical protein CLOM_g23777 [Closterium sp. NIES-68]GJP66868.1 hypothetical protein CLOP_g23752 [Closterium sp. NIES-67]